MGTPKRYYYYASERGCMKDPNPGVIDELGVGVEDGKHSCCLHIKLIRFRDDGSDVPGFTMEASVHNDEWNVFSVCRDVLDVLSARVTSAGEMHDTGPFYGLRSIFEGLGYKNLGKL